MKTLVCLLCAFLCLSGKSEDKKIFEGRIVYRTSVTSPKNSPYLKYVQDGLGDSLVIYFKNEQYRIEFTGEPRTWVIYLDSVAKQYTWMQGVDTLFIDDCSTDENEVTNTVHKRKEASILGKKCDYFSIEMPKDTMEFYYAPEYYIPSSHFDNHVFSHMDLYYAACSAPYLKMVKRSRAFVITYEAISIEEMALNDTLFDVRSELPVSSFKER